MIAMDSFSHLFIQLMVIELEVEVQQWSEQVRPLVQQRLREISRQWNKVISDNGKYVEDKVRQYGRDEGLDT